MSMWPTTLEGSSLDVKVDEIKQKEHYALSLDLLIYIFLLCITILTMWAFKQKGRVLGIHESGLAIVYGLLIGIILRYTSFPREITRMKVVPQSSYTNDLEEGLSPETDEVPKVLPDYLLIAFNFSRDQPSVNGFLTHVPEEELLSPSESRIENKVFSYGFVEEYEESEEKDISEVQEMALFNPEIFFYVLLPPIIFHAGYSMKKKSFFNNFGSILTFAILGTVICVMVASGILYFFTSFIPSPQFTYLDLVYFSSVVSATDPVTVICIFSELRVDMMLNGLVLGESLLNDAVAIVLCSTIEKYFKLELYNSDDELEFSIVFEIFLKFLLIFWGSLLVGFCVAALNALTTKFIALREHPLLETSLFFCLSYSSYLIAELVHCTGIVSVLFCGIAQAHYTFKNLSLESQRRTCELAEFLNFISENFVFCYLGVSMFTFMKHKFEFIFIFGSFVAIAVGRACNIYPLSLLLNCGRKQTIPLSYQHMMWFAGLRGAISFALAIRNTATVVRQIFFSTTCIIIIGTVLFNGGLTVTVLSCFRIPIGVTDEEQELLLPTSPEDEAESTPEGIAMTWYDGEGGMPEGGSEENLVASGSKSCQTNNSPKRSSNKSSNSNTSTGRRSWLAIACIKLDARYIQPTLTNSKPPLTDTCSSCCMCCARCFTSDAQIDEVVDEKIVKQNGEAIHVNGNLVASSSDANIPDVGRSEAEE